MLANHTTTHDAPTQALDLRADALASAELTLEQIADKLCYLSDLATMCRRFGYELPFRGADLAPALDAVREVAGLVRGGG